MSDAERKYFKKILHKYNNGTASEEEVRFLESFYNLFEENPDLINDENENSFLEIKSSIKKNIDVQIAADAGNSTIRVRNWSILKYAAAAAIVISLVAYFAAQQFRDKNKQDTYAHIKPGGNKATLTLANGTVILLDTASRGQIAQQTGISITKTADGMLVYTITDQAGKAANSTTALHNVISTPNGGQYVVLLPDGSRVMLNAASSLKYPVAFNGTERLVELDGEAYFEVAKNKQQPFLVKSKGQTVTVLGTHFNVNAYANEAAIKTTLLEGAVKVSTAAQNQTIQPGEQAVVNADGQAIAKLTVNTDKEVAWKNGLFSFEGDDVKTVMRQVARWYNIDVRYEGTIPNEHFFGEISRSSKLSDVFKILEANDLHFEVDNNTVTISYIPTNPKN